MSDGDVCSDTACSWSPYPRQFSSDFRIFRNLWIMLIDFLSIISNNFKLFSTSLRSPLIIWHWTHQLLLHSFVLPDSVFSGLGIISFLSSHRFIPVLLHAAFRCTSRDYPYLYTPAFELMSLITEEGSLSVTKIFDLPLIDLASVFGKVFTRSCMTLPQAFSTLFGSSHKCMVKTVGLHNLQPSNDYNHLLLPCWLMVSFLAFDCPPQTQSTLYLHERMHAIM